MSNVCTELASWSEQTSKVASRQSARKSTPTACSFPRHLVNLSSECHRDFRIASSCEIDACFSEEISSPGMFETLPGDWLLEEKVVVLKEKLSTMTERRAKVGWYSGRRPVLLGMTTRCRRSGISLMCLLACFFGVSNDSSKMILHS